MTSTTITVLTQVHIYHSFVCLRTTDTHFTQQEYTKSQLSVCHWERGQGGAAVVVGRKCLIFASTKQMLPV